MKPQKVLLVDDCPAIRLGLAHIIARRQEYSVVGEAGTVAEVSPLVTEQHPDLVILDLSLPDGSGLDVLKALRRLNPPVAVLILSMHTAPVQVREALCAGAGGYIAKESAAKSLLEGMAAVLQGHTYLDPSLDETMM